MENGVTEITALVLMLATYVLSKRNLILQIDFLSIVNYTMFKFDSFQVGLSPSKKIIFIYLNKSPLKMMKNAFYFMSKGLFVLEIFHFHPDILVM